MEKNEYSVNKSKFKEINKSNQEITYSALPELEKDIFILINYIRTNPLDFCNNLINKNNSLNKEQIEIIKYLKEIYNSEKLIPFDEIPEI